MAEITIHNPEEFRQQATLHAGEAVDAFCHVYPLVKEGLLLLQQIAPAIPRMGFFIGAAINLVMAAADAAARALCPETAGGGSPREPARSP